MKDQSATPKFGAGRRSKYRHGAPDTGVQAITNAAEPHSEDMHRRMVQYAVTMGIRMVCLLLIFVFDGWFKLVPIVGAVVLPWVAVMIANGGADVNAQETVELLDEAPRYALDAGDTDMSDAEPAPGDVLTGELVPDTDGDAADAGGTDPGGAPAGGGSAAADGGATADGVTAHAGKAEDGVAETAATTAADEAPLAGAGRAWPMGPAAPGGPTGPAPEAAHGEDHQGDKPTRDEHTGEKRQEEMHHEHL